MPITCPNGKEARYRFSKRKLSGGKRARLAFCGNKAVEVTIFKGKKKLKAKKLKGWFGDSAGHRNAALGLGHKKYERLLPAYRAAYDLADRGIISWKQDAELLAKINKGYRHD
jgi:hypothetical protein